MKLNDKQHEERREPTHEITNNIEGHADNEVTRQMETNTWWLNFAKTYKKVKMKKKKKMKKNTKILELQTNCQKKRNWGEEK